MESFWFRFKRHEHFRSASWWKQCCSTNTNNVCIKKCNEAFLYAVSHGFKVRIHVKPVAVDPFAHCSETHSVNSEFLFQSHSIHQIRRITRCYLQQQQKTLNLKKKWTPECIYFKIWHWKISLHWFLSFYISNVNFQFNRFCILSWNAVVCISELLWLGGFCLDWAAYYGSPSCAYFQFENH